MDTDELDKEELHQATVQACFDMYLQSSISGNQRRRGDFFSLSREHQALLPGYADLLAEVSCSKGRGARQDLTSSLSRGPNVLAEPAAPSRRIPRALAH